MSFDVGEVTERLDNELQLILQPLSHSTYVTAHSPTLPSLYLRRSSLSNPSVASSTSQPILQPFRHFIRHNSFSNPSVALPTSLLILQSFRYFTYVRAHSPTLLSLILCHWLFTYVTWRAAHVKHNIMYYFTKF